ncbi:hypothetical protein E2C01_082670 [Portunus trituberculatus]|uniref:Uncharacterized protein n=1 Tax=Portunus trituberculatus TaxID=210409 RepID=A0A5B7J1G2_PORTR|nr:hypothetical protein [Portunus trituberculatus]
MDKLENFPSDLEYRRTADTQTDKQTNEYEGEKWSSATLMEGNGSECEREGSVSPAVESWKLMVALTNSGSGPLLGRSPVPPGRKI